MKDLKEVLSEARRVEELNESIDYFDEYDKIPPKVLSVLKKYVNMDEYQNEYDDMRKAIDALKPLGWTFDFDMDGSMFELEPFNSKGKALLKKK